MNCNGIEGNPRRVPELAEADRYCVDRPVKTLLRMKGGFRIFVRGDLGIFETRRGGCAPGGSGGFDADFMVKVCEHPLEVVSWESLPEEKGRRSAAAASLPALERSAPRAE